MDILYAGAGTIRPVQLESTGAGRITSEAPKVCAYTYM